MMSLRFLTPRTKPFAVVSSPRVKCELLVFNSFCGTGIYEFIAGLLHVALHVLMLHGMMTA